MASQLIGAMKPPPGVEPNFIDPPSLEQSNIIQHATCLSIIFIFIAMRLYTRLNILKARLGIDDFFCVLAYALNFAYSMTMVTACSKGLGRHMWDIPAVNVVDAFKYLMIATWVYMLTTGAIKLTFLCTYLRIFSARSTVKAFIYLGIVVVSGLTISLFFTTLFMCNPIAKSWDGSLPGKCLGSITMAYVSAISSSVTDLYIWALPIVPLWRLNMSPRKKLQVMVAFSFGLLACAASLVRLGMTHILRENPDASYTTAAIGKWSALEIDIGIICSCLMTLPAFVKHHVPESWRSSMSHSLSRLLGSIEKSGKISDDSWRNGAYQNMDQKKHPMKTQDSLMVTQASVELY